LICSFNFLIFLAVCLNIFTVIIIKILTNSNQQAQSYKFTSHITAFLSGFDHRDSWNLHTNIWSKRSRSNFTWSVWYHLNAACLAEKQQIPIP
jgi:NADH:ubiquinone oxidoreductase subunit 3 (subunit A)